MSGNHATFFSCDNKSYEYERDEQFLEPFMFFDDDDDTREIYAPLSRFLLIFQSLHVEIRVCLVLMCFLGLTEHPKLKMLC